MADLPTKISCDADSELADLEEQFYRWHIGQAPEFSTVVGERIHNDKLTDMSIENLQDQHEVVQGFLKRAKCVDRDQLSRKRQYNYDTFLDTLTTFTSNYKWKDYGRLNPVNFMDTFYLIMEYHVEVTPFDSKQDYENFFARLQARPTQISQMISRMQESIRLGTTYHKVSVDRVPDQIQGVTSVVPAESVLYRPFKVRLDQLDLSQEDKIKLRSGAQQAIQCIWDALNNLSTFISKDYMPHTRSSYGVDCLPAGEEYYRACLKWHLSLDLTPSQVHQTGLREVTRISQLMKMVMDKQGFKGTVAEYFTSLREQTQFHLHSAEEIIKRYEDLIYTRIEPKMHQIFKDIPPGNVSVRCMPFDGPYGSYYAGSEDGSRPGIFYTNVLRPDDTLTFAMMAMTLHEAIPGHHLQYVYERTAGLPNFVKHIEYDHYYAVPFHFPFYTTYLEGWGLYAEYLGEELDVYQDDYEMMGRYRDEILRASRLVVDTGLHSFGWSRDQAIEYLQSHSPLSQTEAEIEIDRYITWPGQACAYKIGEMKIKELRERAKNELGSSFDIREFHSMLLNSGSMPLSVLENLVNDYIADNTRNNNTEPQGTPGFCHSFQATQDCACP